ncbi:MAG: YqeG family HAD IIIA-type phosphatase [bacterium]|nr:YqeG family HAD IIIA-type phosphatase [bacterium]
MLFERTLMPDEMYDRFDMITPEHLKSLGIKYIFSDIDNTLATYDDPTPPENVLRWLDLMEDNGIKVAFVSNNKEERVALFNRELKYVAYSKAKKPLTGKLKRAMRDLGAERGNSLLLGDQLLTDAAAGNRAGMYVIIVPPIKDVLTPFFRFKRRIEMPYIEKFKKSNKNK